MNSRAPVRIFVGGCERSGTTHLAAQISRWTGLTFLPESMFFLRSLRRYEGGSGDLSGLLRKAWRLRAWDLSQQQVQKIFDDASSCQEVLDAMAREYSAGLGESKFVEWIEHTPINTSYMPLIDRHFTDHRYINIHRDGRAVAASILNVDFGPTTIRGAAA